MVRWSAERPIRHGRSTAPGLKTTGTDERHTGVLDWLEPTRATLVALERQAVSRRDNVCKSFDVLRVAIAQELHVKDAILYGEIVCLDAVGRSMFKELLFRRGNPVFYAFDLLWLNGRDLRH
jgi:hypothetical protein